MPVQDFNRKIIHIDMDAFYASVEQRDDPSLRGKPVGIGSEERRGVICTASYEARKYGVHSAMSGVQAKRLCPELILVPPNFAKYKQVSQQVHEIFHRYTDLVEPLSLDEAYLDVTQNKLNIELAVDIAQRIRQEIRTELQLTASAGVSFNKFLAKVASDFRKPDGITVIHPSRAIHFVGNLPITDFWGVGHKTAETMHAMGIFNGADLRQLSRLRLQQVFGKAGETYYNFARAIDNRAVEPHWIRKSVGCERTFEEDSSNPTVLLTELYRLVLELVERLKKNEFKGRTLTLKVKFYNFTQITRSRTVPHILLKKDDILPVAKALLREVDYTERPVRLLGVQVSNIDDTPHRPQWIQLELPFKKESPFEELRNYF